MKITFIPFIVSFLQDFVKNQKLAHGWRVNLTKFSMGLSKLATIIIIIIIGSTAFYGLALPPSTSSRLFQPNLFFSSSQFFLVIATTTLKLKFKNFPPKIKKLCSMLKS